MGITGLIPFLDKASSKLHLKDIQGCTVAVDTYCWLHKGVFSCADKLVRGEQTDQYIQYCLKYVQLLLSYDIKPILVFDGRHLPAKALTEQRRREARQQSKKRAILLLRAGRIAEARSHMRRCVDVTHEMALHLIRECRLRNVDCIVAPYEADAQMAWFNKENIAQYIITEDSDLTLFGARQIIFKLDINGTGLLVEADKLYLAMGCKKEKYKFETFRRMCILSGCDYLDSLPGIGLAKACKFFLKTEEDDMWRALKRLPTYLNMPNLQVNNEYIDSFLKAEATFKHMYIYNPLKRRQERLHELQDNEIEENYCSNAGEMLQDADLAFQLALGNVNPFTFKTLDTWHPDYCNTLQTHKNIKRARHKSIWQQNYTNGIEKAKTVDAAAGGAFFFKKLNLSNVTTESDNGDNSDKLEESEIYTMYKCVNTEEMEPQNKRIRLTRQATVNSAPVSPVANRTRQNPFAKVNTTLEKSPICANASLLKVLSPSKCKIEIERQAMRVNRLSRKLYSTETMLQEQQKTQTEVKSRFFCSTAEQQQMKSNVKSPRNSKSLDASTQLVDQIQEVENIAKQQQEQPTNLPLSYTDSGIESLCAESTANQTTDEDRISVSSDSTAILVEATADSKPLSIEDNAAIEISDDDASSTIERNDITARLRQFNAVAAKTQLIVPKLGLSRPRTTTGKTVKKLQKAASTASALTPTKSQTRLSMFGFQKKPLLK